MLLAILLAVAPPAWAKTYQVTLYSHAVEQTASGATSAGTSGVTQLVVDHAGQPRSDGEKGLDLANASDFEGDTGAVWMVWVKELDFSPAQQNVGGTVSDTFDLLFKFAPREGLNAGVTRYAFKNESITSLADNTVGPRYISVPPNTYVTPWLVSGTTPLGNCEIGMVIGFPPSLHEDSILVDEDHSDFTTSGVTQIYSGVTAIQVAAGARTIKAIANGDDLWYTTDGTTTPADESYGKLTDGEWETFTPYEWERFWFTVDGDAAGVLTIKQFSD